MNLKTIDELVHASADLMHKSIADLTYQHNHLFEKILRTEVTPPIRGPITKYKLRSRHIKVRQYGSLRSLVIWVEQNGVQIGPKIDVKYSFELIES